MAITYSGRGAEMPALALAHRNPGCRHAADRPPGRSTIGPGHEGLRDGAPQEPAIVFVWKKPEFLALGLAGHRQAERSAKRPHLGFAQMADREYRPRSSSWESG